MALVLGEGDASAGMMSGGWGHSVSGAQGVTFLMMIQAGVLVSKPIRRRKTWAFFMAWLWMIETVILQSRGSPMGVVMVLIYCLLCMGAALAFLYIGSRKARPVLGLSVATAGWVFSVALLLSLIKDVGLFAAYPNSWDIQCWYLWLGSTVFHGFLILAFTFRAVRSCQTQIKNPPSETDGGLRTI